MSKLSDREISEVTGSPLTKPKGPESRIGDAVDKLGELDGRMASLTEKHRQPGESHEQAQSRLMIENPTLYSQHKAAKAKILMGKGFGDAAIGGV